ncbi:MAG: hypothetical protein QM490_01845 [Candidatus Gracilibacteria bacterium]
MRIELHGQFKDDLKSEIETHEEFIEINLALSKDENTYYEIEETTNKILASIEEKNNIFQDMNKRKFKYENIDIQIKEKKQLEQARYEAEKYLYDYKRKETHTSIETEQFETVKKRLQEIEVDLYETENEIKEFSKFEENEELETQLRSDVKKLEERYYLLADEKLKVIRRIQKQENKIQSIEHLVKTLSGRGGYEVTKSSSNTSSDYFRLYRSYNMKNGEHREYDQEFYSLEDFLAKFGVSTQDISEAKLKDEKLKKLQQKKRLEKSGFNKILKRSGKGKKGKKTGRRLKFENPEVREELIKELEEFKIYKEEELARIKKAMYDKLKDLPKADQDKYLKDYQKKVKEGIERRRNPEAYEAKKRFEAQLKEQEDFLKELEESNIRTKEINDRIKKENDEYDERKKQEKLKQQVELEKIKAENKAREERTKQQEEEVEETVIERIIKPIKNFLNKIKGFFS